MKPKRSAQTLGQEQCWLKFALTDTNLEEGTFKGLASVFGSMVQSWMPTVIEAGAFTKTLKENFGRIKLLWQHDIAEPIGIPKTLAETQKGLEVEGKISQIQRGKEALTLMRDGVVDELSIGFDPIKWEMEDKGNGDIVRHIKEVRLWEISLVTFAADPMAKVMSVHAVVPFQDLPLADEGRAWDKAAAHKRMKDACGLDGDSPDWAKFRKAHVWYDSADAEKMGSYKLMIADLIDGKMTAVPRGIFAAAAVLQGARGGVNIPDDEIEKCKAHIGRYYKKMDRTAPWDEAKNSLEFIAEMLSGLVPLEAHEGKVLSAKNKKLLQDAVAALQDLIAAAEPPDDDKQALTVDAERINRLRDAELALAQLQLH